MGDWLTLSPPYGKEYLSRKKKSLSLLYTLSTDLSELNWFVTRKLLIYSVLV